MTTRRTTAHEQDFTDFTEASYASLLRTARLLTGDRHAAEDLVQAALVKVYLRWGRSAEPGTKVWTYRPVERPGDSDRGVCPDTLAVLEHIARGTTG